MENWSSQLYRAVTLLCVLRCSISKCIYERDYVCAVRAWLHNYKLYEKKIDLIFLAHALMKRTRYKLHKTNRNVLHGKPNIIIQIVRTGI